jgi:hypothetical protein
MEVQLMSDELYPGDRLEVDQLQEQYQRLHGVSVEFLKASVGPGDEYSNSAARAVISPNGAWFECVDLPMEFSGAAGAPVEYHFVTDAQVLDLIAGLYDSIPLITTANTRRFGLFSLYTQKGIADGQGVYAFQFENSADGTVRRPNTVGKYQAGRLPLVFRARIDTDLDISALKVHNGVIFCLTGIGERALMVKLPYEGKDLRDLADSPGNPLMQ